MRKMLLCVLAASLCFLFPPVHVSALEVGAVPPDFELESLDGKTVRLSDFKGRIILLKLATTWCHTCKQQAAEILAVEKDLHKKGVAVIEVFVQDTETQVKKSFKGDTAKEHFALLDNGRVARAYNVWVVPRMLLIDKGFTIFRDRAQLLPGDELLRQIDRIERQ